jgi:NTE family protein
MNTPSSSSPRERALVLGGGGSSGNAWLIGVLAGLLAAGVDVTDADLIIGTSAGATTAAQVTGASPAQLLADTLAATPPPHTDPARSGGGSGLPASVVDHLERMNRIIAGSDDAADMRRRMGVAAIELETASDGSRQPRWRATVASRLPRHSWPERDLLITVVDADTGEPVAFDRASGVDLVDAVAASTSGGPAYRIGDHWYIDGGYRSVENADLAAGYERVLVLSPFGGATRHPLEWGTHLAAQVEELRARGSRVETIAPESGTEHLFGANSMDYSLRPLVARTGSDQGRALAGHVAEFWAAGGRSRTRAH